MRIQPSGSCRTGFPGSYRPSPGMESQHAGPMGSDRRLPGSSQASRGQALFPVYGALGEWYDLSMARPLRIEFPGAIYHVMSRGNARQTVFREEGDYQRPSDGLARVVHRMGWEVLSFVLMPNHFHLLVRTPQPNLSRGMQYLTSGYANWFARRHQRPGHTFQGRFGANSSRMRAISGRSADTSTSIPCGQTPPEAGGGQVLFRFMVLLAVVRSSMARPLRVEFPRAIYHVMSRATRQGSSQQGDYQRLCDGLARVVDRMGSGRYSHCPHAQSPPLAGADAAAEPLAGDADLHPDTPTGAPGGISGRGTSRGFAGSSPVSGLRCSWGKQRPPCGFRDGDRVSGTDFGQSD